MESRNYLILYWIMLAYHLDCLPYVLNPLALLGARGRCHHQRPLSIVNIEAELGSHPWLTVDNLIKIKIIITAHYTQYTALHRSLTMFYSITPLEVRHCELSMNSELEAGAWGAVGVEQHVRKLKHEKYLEMIFSLR